MSSRRAPGGPPAAPSSTLAGGTRRRIDDRIPTLIDDAVRRRHRCLFLLIGDKGKDQIVNLHAMVSRAQHSAKVNVLWCMKSDPVFTSVSKKKLERQGELEVKSGVATETSKETFETFLQQTEIRFCHYAESHKILGQTFGMAVLQDFEALTPNILARTVETVAGGGMVILLLRSLQSLKQIHTLVMDVHSRYRTAAHKNVVPRFNERFLLSLCDCESALVIDDDLHVMPVTSNMRDLLAKAKRRRAAEDATLRLEGRQLAEAQLTETKKKLKDAAEIGPLVSICQTMDQVKVVLAMARVLHDNALNVTCALTAARGRGKSAALGLAVASAIHNGYSNIFVTAPTPENVQTLFQFVVRGLTELGYKERRDFETMVSSNPDYAKNTILRVNIFKQHRQTVQFIAADDSNKFAQAELLVIDEAAAIPLPLVQKMLGNYLVFISSTVSGYEGTGRALSMKLIADMRRRAQQGSSSAPSGDGTVDDVAAACLTVNTGSGKGSDASPAALAAASSSRRSLKELQMTDPIRYGPDDPLEAWLTRVLCLDATQAAHVPKAFPHHSSCELYYVDRDALFSYHAAAESLLQQLVSLFVAAHYKNQPNDLQLLSDAPAHHIFALCGPQSTPPAVAAADGGASGGGGHSSPHSLPDIFCVVHLCEEGSIGSDALESQLGHGSRPSGDLIPYTLAQQYLNKRFADCAGLRIVRIATHPEYQRGGYGTRALQLLLDFFGGKMYNGSLQGAPMIGNGPSSPSSRQNESATAQRDNDDDDENDTEEGDRERQSNSAQSAAVSSRKLPALLQPLTSVAPCAAAYVGVSFGLNLELFNFWKKNGFHCVYVRQSPSDVTAEHSCIMLRGVPPLGGDGGGSSSAVAHAADPQNPTRNGVVEASLSTMRTEFQRRFVSLLPLCFRQMRVDLALSCLVDVADVQPRRLAELTKVSACSATGATIACAVNGVPQATFRDLVGNEPGLLNPSALKRLKLFSTNFVDAGLVLDAIPLLAATYFGRRVLKCPDGTDGVTLTHAQAAVLLGIGLQCYSFEQLASSTTFAGVVVAQLKAFFHKAVCRLVEHIGKLEKLALSDRGSLGGAAGLRSPRPSNLEGPDHAVEEEDTAAEEVRFDHEGNVIGMTLARPAAPTNSTDAAVTALLADSKRAAFSAGSPQSSKGGGGRRGGGSAGGGGESRKRHR